MISIRRISLGGGFRYLMESVAKGDGAAERTTDLARYYAESDTPPGVFLGAGLADLDGGRGSEPVAAARAGADARHQSSTPAGAALAKLMR